MPETIYADSNVFILPVIYGNSGRGADASRILHKVETGELVAYTSYLTWDEVVWVVRRTLGRADSVESGRKLLGFPNLRFVEVSESIITKGQSLLDKYHLNPRDAIHCSSAISRGVNMFVSDDSDFDGIKEIKRLALSKVG